MFWLMELDLVSLKGNSVSSGRFWGVYGFSMSLGSPSGFDSVRHIYFCSCFKVSLSACLLCCQPPSCPWNYCQSFCSQVPSCTAGLTLLVRGLYGSFCGSLTMPSALPESCVGFPQPPELAFCVARHVCTSLGSLGLPSVSWDLLHLFRLPRPASVSWGLCSHVSVLWNCPLHCKFCVL